VRAADRHRALPECRRGAGARDAASGVSCTFRSDGLVAENYGYYAGGKDWQRDISRRLIEQAIACKAKSCWSRNAVMPTPPCAGRRPICTASRCLSRCAT
jgi:hypothetical protein